MRNLPMRMIQCFSLATNTRNSMRPCAKQLTRHFSSPSFQSAATEGSSKTLVVGAGAIGLQTAIECVRRDMPVVLRAPYPPSDPRTCSFGAGGLWMPFHVDSDLVTRWATETLDELLAYAKQETKLVEVVPTVLLLQDHQGPILDDYKSNEDVHNAKSDRLPGWTYDKRIEFQHLTVEMLSWQNSVYKLRIPDESTLKEAGYLHAWMFRPPIVNSPRMLEHMLQQLMESDLADVDVNTGEFISSTDELCEYAKSLDCDNVVNCSGLGSRNMCDDQELVGARGITLHYDRSHCQRTETVAQSPLHGENTQDAILLIDEGPWGSDTMPSYLIPRGDLIVVGGSYLEGDSEAGIRDEERERLLCNAKILGVDTEKSKPIGEWTGFRPYRSTVRCEADIELASKHSLKTVVHNYGHGGAGWTLYAGAAKHGVDLLETQHTPNKSTR